MSKIRIKNFGPIKEGFDTEDGFMDIKKVTVFIGDQGTGKSTVAKLISTSTWIEKTLCRGGILNLSGQGFKELCEYQGLLPYFISNTEIEYIGEYLYFFYSNDKFHFKSADDAHFKVPQIMYVPAERNFLSVLSNASRINDLPNPLYTFLEQFEKAQRSLLEEIALPLNKINFQYSNSTAYIKGEGYKVKLTGASSGLQSLVPLFLVSRNLALSIDRKKDNYRNSLNLIQHFQLQEEIEKVLLNQNISDDLKQVAIELLSNKYKNSCFINIVEEPEQNLFPTSQRHMLNSLVEFAHMNEGNKLIMTTHSPYIISYLGIAVQGHNLLEKINTAGNPEGFRERMEQVVPERSVIAPEDLVIYQLQENGTISRLPDYEGIPADKNYLNQSLVEGNQLFGALLEIEEDL